MDERPDTPASISIASGTSGSASGTSGSASGTSGHDDTHPDDLGCGRDSGAEEDLRVLQNRGSDDQSREHEHLAEFDRTGQAQEPSSVLDAAPENTALEGLPGSPRILQREEHNISRKYIDIDALKVMYRLSRSGYKAFLVGGGVRDLLLGKKPKDFDVSTDARPEAVRSLFRNSRIIGRRFRMNHVFFRGNKIIEVSTFRAAAEEPPEGEEVSFVTSDNVYGNPESDAIRRDLTINGLFYDPVSYAVIDYVDGINDLQAGTIRMIGEPTTRFREDPVRMIRAIRHAARTGFTIEPQTYDAICELRELINIPARPRIHEEFVRELRGGYSGESFRLMRETKLLDSLLPEFSRFLDEAGEEERAQFESTLERIDRMAKTRDELPASVVLLAIAIEFFSDERLRQIGQSRKILDLLFKPIGLTRREREDMELILLTAHELFRSFDGPEQKRRQAIGRAMFDQALLLIELTANNEDGHSCVEFWRARNRPRRNRRRR